LYNLPAKKSSAGHFYARIKEDTMARLKKRADGRYRMQVYIGTDEQGKRQYKTVYGISPKEVNSKAEEVRLQLKKGLDISAQRDTFETWAERFRNLRKMDGISISQQQSYKNYCNHLSALNHLPIVKIEAADIQKIILSLADWHDGHAPLAKKTLIGIKGTAGQIFDLAIESRVIDYNPAKFVRIPKTAASSHRDALSAEQQQWVVDTPHRAQRAAMLMMYAGLRRGEATALTWADVDLQAGTIRVDKAVEMIKGKPKLKSTKTAAGVRIVQIPQVLADFLKTEKTSESPLCIYVVHTANDKMMTNQAWRVLWRSYMTDLNVKYGYGGEVDKLAARKKGADGNSQGQLPIRIQTFTPHQLRHTFCTIMYLAGVDVMTARDQMGHSDIKTTLEIYTHLDKLYKRSSMQKLDSYLSDAGHIQVKQS
jgi:integrase